MIAKFYYFLLRNFSIASLLFSILLLFYIFFKSEIIWSGDKRTYYYIYYVISLVLIFFSIISFFFNKLLKEYLIISFLTIVLTLYLFESLLLYKSYLAKNITIEQTSLKQEMYKKETGENFDTRSKLEIYQDLKKIDESIKINVPPQNYLSDVEKFFPLSGVSNSKTIFCNENGYYAIYDSDRYGFNNPNEVWEQNEIEYLLVGDSFTHGACVNRPNDIASILRNESKKSVLNLGQSGNGPLIEYATLREYLDTNVNKVLWLYYENNDLFDLKKELKNTLLKKYFDDLSFSQNLKEKQYEINNFLNNEINNSTYQNNIESSINFKIFKFLKMYNLRSFLFLEEKNKKNLLPLNEFKLILQLAKDLCLKNNSQFYFIYLPGFDRYNNQNITNYELVKKTVQDLNINFIDIHSEMFANEENPIDLFPFGLNGHYNVSGYRKVTETIFRLAN